MSAAVDTHELLLQMREEIRAQREEIRAQHQEVAALRKAVDELSCGHEPNYMTTAQLAHRYGMGEDWVYKYARDLGGAKAGGGPKAEWRFQVSLADERFQELNPPAPVRAKRVRTRRASRTEVQAQKLKPRRVLPA